MHMVPGITLNNDVAARSLEFYINKLPKKEI